MSGFVSLVGAGPGDAELLTLRAVRRLQEADLILYDALLCEDVLALASPRAQRFYVGKRAGCRSIRQDTIQRLLIRYARRGLRVVRLKCGDPFIFGRGGEEALALAEAGVAFEIVPGISSAISAPALAGIPVTHREVSRGVAVVSGHSPAAFTSGIDAVAPNTLTLVVLMGLTHRAAIAERLISRGWQAETPAAVLWSASQVNAATWRGTLDTLASAAHPEGDERAAGILCIGAVVSLAEALSPTASAVPQELLRHVAV